MVVNGPLLLNGADGYGQETRRSSHPSIADVWAVLFPDCIRGAANDKWGRYVGLPQPMTSGVVYLFK
jgi:hypothetical protein